LGKEGYPKLVLDNSTKRRLVLAKKLYMHGCRHARNKDVVSRMIAIHNFDNSAEFVAKVAADHLHLSYKEGNFYSPLGTLKNYFREDLSKELSLAKEVEELHKIRNSVQHGGTVPSIETVQRFKDATEQFFREIVTTIFKLSYGEIYLSMLIENDELKGEILQAEKALEQGQYQECVRLCDGAFIAATFDLGDIVSKAGVLTAYWGAGAELRNLLNEEYIQETYGDKDYGGLANEIGKALVQLGQASTTMQFLDEYRVDFLRHRELIDSLSNLSAKELSSGAQASLDFVTDIILRWQEEGLLSTNPS